MPLAKIFLVDDDRAIIEVYHNMLKIRDHTIIGEAFDGEAAVNNYNKLKTKPDIIIMDHRMPFKNGMTAMKEIQAVEPDQCIIFATADLEAAKIALKNGANSFIMKPFHMDALFNSIEMALLEKNKRGLELREAYLGAITRMTESKGAGDPARICDWVDKEIINRFVPYSSPIPIETAVNWSCKFFNTMDMDYTYEKEKNKFIIRNNKCHWMNELGPNPHFCFMSKCVMSKFAMKTGKEFNLKLKKTIMDGSEECYFELTFS